MPKDFIKSMGEKANWVASRNEQDAQEFFQMLMQTFQKAQPLPINTFHSYLKNAQISPESSITIPPSSSSSSTSSSSSRIKNPFYGLAASKIACVTCGYTATCSINDCLSTYTTIDQLDDFRCRKCILNNSIFENNLEIKNLSTKLKETQDKKKSIDAQILSTSSSEIDSKSKDSLINKLALIKKSLKKTQSSLQSLIQDNEKIKFAKDNDPEMNLGEIKLSKKLTGLSTRQTMIARLPQVLCLHLNRSIFTSTGDTIKNDCRVILNPVLDMSPYLTTGHLDTRPLYPISQTPQLNHPKKAAPNPLLQSSNFQLSAVVSHIGSHNSGHYFTYKRIPYDNQDDKSPSYQWFRVSDSDFAAVDESTVLNVGNSFMLFYTKLP
ncbi:Ubiquitin carboxyl-terminal hydrolase 30 [Smittium culicis]|uniref:ubiquitinyl hydrolase 1 n=1 Tax=Smittium culicis TaxID=133412 RepID=A0A1R1Y5F8_9FUNG|nr:Ubiquitin carboxyl-terminal hydrolase 30 [Smittium culicis]